MSRQEVREFVAAALECSVYISPREPGLTRDELLEAGARVGYYEGELLDSLSAATHPQYAGVPRLLPRRTSQWGTFLFAEEPEYRNVDAFEFVFSVLRDLVRKEGTARACIDRSVLVTRAVAAGLPERDVEAAIVILTWSEYLAEDKDHLVRFAPGKENHAPPRTQVDQSRSHRPIRREQRARAYPIVEDVISRRTGSRPLAAEPLDAFATSLASR